MKTASHLPLNGKQCFSLVFIFFQTTAFESFDFLYTGK